jgi:hypothetical protein
VELQVSLQALATGSIRFSEGTKNSSRPVTVGQSVWVRRKHILSASGYYALLGIATVIVRDPAVLSAGSSIVVDGG